MPSSLATQLAQLAANSKATLNTKTQKAAHSKSLLWEARVAATQSYQTLFATCYTGFKELCQLDPRFQHFQSTIFSDESQHQDRSQLTADENAALDREIEAFLRLVGSRLRLMPAITAIEWLIRRFRIHEQNTGILLTTFLPYHSIPAFATLLSILPSRIPSEFRFLIPYIRSVTPPPRPVLVQQAIRQPEFLVSVSDYTLESCRRKYHYPALITFWGGLMAEAITGILDKVRSGRAAVQSDNVQSLLHRIGPVFSESLSMKKIPTLQVASYMAIVLFVSKAHLEDAPVTAFMEQIVHCWTHGTRRPALVCLAILAQFRSPKQMSSKVTKALIKVSEIGDLLVEISLERSVDKLANGLCLALIDRFIKKGDSRGLTTIMAILSSRVLKDQQIAVIFKSLLLTALKLDESNDKDGLLRRELGSALICLSHTTGKSGDIIQTVIQDIDFDIEELEMKLALSLRARKLPGFEAGLDDTVVSKGTTQAQPIKDLEGAVDKLSALKKSLPDCLQSKPNVVFEEFSHLFFAVASEKTNNAAALTKFDHSPKLRRQDALDDTTYFSFFIRIWCGPYPALVRKAALDMTKSRLSAVDQIDVDLQVLMPYCLVALGDPSKRVRRSAADMIKVLTGLYSPSLLSDKMRLWGLRSFLGSKDKALSSTVAARFLHLQILPCVEECVLDGQHIYSVLKPAIEKGRYRIAPSPALDKKDHMSQSGRGALLTFFACLVNETPFLVVKERLLKALNEVRGVGSTTRTELLLPALQWWINLSEEEADEACRQEQLVRSELDSRFVDVIVPKDSAGLEFLLKTLKDPSKRAKAGLLRAMFSRIREMWPSIKDGVKPMIAEQLLDISQEPAEDPGSSMAAGEAADVLRAVPLTTDILSSFLDSIQTSTKIVTEPPPNKRRRTSSSEASRGLASQVTPELSQALRKATFVLQLVESSDPLSHPELLHGLFTALSELQHFKTVVGTELDYLQNLVLRSLLAMMPAYRANKNLKIDRSGGYGDLLVNCVQKPASPVVHNAALLLIADLATTAPELVLHSVMPIFTFMGSSTLRQSDDYSAHVISQTIKEVIPPLIVSLRRGQRSAVKAACNILVSFTTAYEHIPAHRRQNLFLALARTLGPREFLFALISMLVNRYETSDALVGFIVDLLAKFDVETQLETLDKMMDLISDLFLPKPDISSILLSDGEGQPPRDVKEVAFRQLSALPSFLSNKTLKAHIGKLAELDDMEAVQVRTLYSALLEKVLVLADTVKTHKALHELCGAALSNLLNLLSIGKFIKAVEDLLDRQNAGLRHKVLRALEARVEAEKNTDPASRKALLAFLPLLTAAIRETSDMRFKYTAVTCVDKIAEKYGKMDVEAVVAAATTIAGDRCLGQSERRLRIMALLCLTSLVDVLQDAVVPVLPVAIPSAVTYLNESLDGESADGELHSACYGFLGALAEHLPYMLSPYIDQVLAVSYRSAEAGLGKEVNDSRSACLGILAKQVDAKDMVSSFLRTWNEVAGCSAALEVMQMLGAAISKHPKSVISKNARALMAIFMRALDIRPRLVMESAEADEGALIQLAAVENEAYEQALKMVYKLNDATFRPLFAEIMAGAVTGPSKEGTGRVLLRCNIYGFLERFFGQLKSIVTSYAAYVVDDAVDALRTADIGSAAGRQLWGRVLKTLTTCFEHDQDEFWQAPAHFGAVAPVLAEQLLKAGTTEVQDCVIPALVELAAAADSQEHQRELNGALMKHLGSEQAAVRLGAVRCQQALTERLGEEWLSMLHEMLPRISELQEDEDEEVERETHRWIVKIEGVLGESLDVMLQ
ncbi:U3 small nucleolar RNA-associated protein [Ophiocordyceps camponoti-floridani]|uniref:U3 small nucleolar RNA-associated protein 10 n=1 Tax=Ophiocordyceps camponoti-floridani TaxID=2030778 RepID=A0A8H4Q553_9HYPO|nr:U3 small nucleolar RNA-associated protein [Ophiocordyceps camponoti-floridani]